MKIELVLMFIVSIECTDRQYKLGGMPYEKLILSFFVYCERWKLRNAYLCRGSQSTEILDESGQC